MSVAQGEDGGRLPLSPALQATLLRARDYAAGQSHAQVTLEHLLLALTEDDDATQVIRACGIDVGGIRNDVASYLGGLEQRVPPGTPGAPAISGQLTQILKYATLAAQQGRRPRIDGAIVLAALIGDGRSMAAGFLTAQGLTFAEAVRVLQGPAAQQVSRPQQQPDPLPLPAPATTAPAANAPGASDPAPAQALAPPPPPELRRSADDILAATRARLSGRQEAPRHVPARSEPADPQANAQPAPAHIAERPANPMPPSPGHVASESAARDAPPQPSAPTLIPQPLVAPEPPAGSGQPLSPAPPARPAPNLTATQQAAVSSGWHPPPLPVPQPAPHRQPPSTPPPPHPRNGAPQLDAAPLPAPHPRPESQRPVPPRTDGRSQDRPREPAPRPAPGPPQTGSTPGGPVHPRNGGLRPEIAHNYPNPNYPTERPADTTSRSTSPIAAASGSTLDPAHLQHNIPSRLRVGTPVVIHVRVQRPLLPGTPGPGRPHALRSEIVTARALSVRLRSVAPGVIVECQSPETQWDLAGTPDRMSAEAAMWRFVVTPTLRSSGGLQLTVGARLVGVEGVIIETALPDQTYPVRVQRRLVPSLRACLGFAVALLAGAAALTLLEAILSFDLARLMRRFIAN